MPPAIIFRTNNYAPAMPGVNRRLTNSEVDANWKSVLDAIDTLETDRPQPNQIANITSRGASLTFILDDATEIGPIGIPIIQMRDRGEWQPFTAYEELDVFIVPEQGVYSVLLDHTSYSVFDENSGTAPGGDPFYHKIYGDNASAFEGSVPISALPAAVLPVDPTSLLEISEPTGATPAYASKKIQLSDLIAGSAGFTLGSTPISPGDVITSVSGLALVAPDLGVPTAIDLSNATNFPLAELDGLAAGVATFLATPSSANLAAAVTGETGSGALVFATSPTLVTPNLGVPSAVDLANASNLPLGAIAGFAAGIAAFLAAPSSANLAATVTDETGTGALVFANSPVLVTPNLGTPSAVNLANATNVPAGSIAGLGAGVATFLATPSSANLAAAVTDETGTGALVFANSPILVTPNLGTPSAANLANATNLPLASVTGFAAGVAAQLAAGVTLGATTLTGFTPGSVLYVGAAGLVSQDNTRFFYDSATGNLGIGTNVPGLSTSAASRYITIKGNTGSGRLEFVGAAADSDGATIGQVLASDFNNAAVDKRPGFIAFQQSGATALNRGGKIIIGTRPDNSAAPITRVTFDRDGNTALGTLNAPLATLHVGAVAATARIYNAYTDSSNGEWGYLGDWLSNVARYGTDRNGTGVARDVSFVRGGVELLRLGSAGVIPAGASAGASGGIPYFGSSGQFLSTAAIPVGNIILGGGAGASPFSYNSWRLISSNVFEGNFNAVAGPVTPLPGIHVVAADSVTGGLLYDAFGAVPLFIGRVAGGTNAVPAATANGATLIQLGGRGYDTAYTTDRAYLRLFTSELWSSTGNGTAIDLTSTKTGTLTTGPIARLGSAGMSFGNFAQVASFSIFNPNSLTTAATSRIYNTFTDTSNGEWAYFGDWNSNVARYGTDKNGSGTFRDTAIMAGGIFGMRMHATTQLIALGPGAALSSAFPALKRSAAILQSRLGDDSAYAAFEAATLRSGIDYTVATLPAVGTRGRRAQVTDALSPVYLAAVAGGGAVVCPVFDNGTTWIVG